MNPSRVIPWWCRGDEISLMLGDTICLLYLVFKAGDAEVKQVQQAVDLQDGHIRHPTLKKSSICVLHHPQETHQQRPAALGWQRAGLPPSLVKTNTQTLSQFCNLRQNWTKWLFIEKEMDRKPPTGKHGRNTNAFQDDRLSKWSSSFLHKRPICDPSVCRAPGSRMTPASITYHWGECEWVHFGMRQRGTRNCHSNRLTDGAAAVWVSIFGVGMASPRRRRVYKKQEKWSVLLEKKRKIFLML